MRNYMEPMNESKFNMWRGCVAIVYLDNVVKPEEKAWVENKCNTLPLSFEQKAILLNDLKNGIKLDEVLPKITDKVDRGFLVNTFLVLANIDHNFTSDEKIAFKNLESKVLKGLDLTSITNEIKTMEKESYNESEVYKNYNSSSLFEKVHHAFMKSINPGDYTFPK